LWKKIGDRTEIIFIDAATGIHSDYCLLQSKKVFPDGSIVILGCSVDHKDVPTTKVERGVLDLFSYYIESVEHGCKIYALYQVHNFNLNIKFDSQIWKEKEKYSKHSHKVNG